MFPVYNLWFLQHEVEDAIFCLQPCFYVLQKRPATMHPPPLFSPSVYHCVSRLCTGRQLVQKQASCPPPQTQRWRNWAPSTLSSYSSTLNVSTDREAGGRAGRQPSQRLTPPPLLPLPPTHTLIYTRSWFFISRGASSVSQCFSQACTSFVFLRLIYIHHVTTRERVCAEWSENGDMELSSVWGVHVCPCVTCVCLPTDCSLKVKDVLREFDADGSLARHRHGEVRGRSALLFTIRSTSPTLQNTPSAIRHTTQPSPSSQQRRLVGNEHLIHA